MILCAKKVLPDPPEKNLVGAHGRAPLPLLVAGGFSWIGLSKEGCRCSKQLKPMRLGAVGDKSAIYWEFFEEGVWGRNFFAKKFLPRAKLFPRII